ncbi:MAG: HAD family hydrolase [Chloroflexi bacterium]|nr:HAD family hydrolase [Chloroflexota bacterium]
MRTSLRPRLLALDVDGTLTWPGVGPDQDVIRALGGVAAQDVTVVVATGRGTYMTAEVTRQLPAGAYAVLNNGGIVRRVRDGHVLRARHMTHAAAAAVLGVYRDCGMAGVWVESPFAGERYLCDGAWWTHAPTRLYLSTKLPIIRPMPSTAIAAPPVEVFAFGDREAVAGAERRINDELGDAVSTVSWWSERLGAGGLESLPAGGTKGEGVAWLADELGIDAAEVVAVGDDRNDIEMLQWAGRGIAMSHAPPDVQAAADEVATIEGPPAVRQVMRDVWGL